MGGEEGWNKTLFTFYTSIDVCLNFRLVNKYLNYRKNNMGVQRNLLYLCKQEIRVFHRRDAFDLSLEEWVGFGL